MVLCGPPAWSNTRVVLIVSVITLLLHITESGRFIEYKTDGSIKLSLMNDYGVPISGFTKLLFEVQACANAYFVLSEVSNFANSKGKYFMVMLGTTKTKRMNGIKDSCFKCATFHANAVKTTLNCNDFKSYFARWDNKGNIKIGDGTDATNLNNVFLKYQSKNQFALNFLNVMSQKNNATWRFRVDSAPEYTAPLGHGATVIKVSEDTPTNKEIFELKAWDPEDDNITFTLGDKHRDVFKVEGSSLMLNNSLDYETRSFYSIDLSVSDGFNSVPVAMAIRVTDVNDEPPTLNYNDEVKVPEEMPVGYVISGLFSATDRDSNDSMTFMLEGAESTFLNLSDNVLRVQQRIDHDGKDGHSSLNGLTFRVFDSKNHESNITKNITIMDMNDNAPRFPQYVYRVNVTENSTSDTFLLQLSAIDNDSGGNGQVVYSLAGDNDTTKYFKLNGSNLFVDGDRIDLETMADDDSDELLLTVVAIDTPEFELPQTGSATIRLKIISKNEYDPVWTSPKVDNGKLPEMNISEDAAPLTTVVILTAKDEDNGEDGRIIYSIQSVTTGSGSQANKTFWIDAKTGELKTAALLDSDTSTGGEEYYDLSLMASDAGSPTRTVTASVRIRISNVNDNPPAFNNTVMEVPLSKSLGRGDLVVSLVANDPDGDNMTFTLAGQSKDLFEYDGKELKAAKKINPKTSYVLILKASDGRHEVAATAIIGGGGSQNASSSSSSGKGGEMVVEAMDGVEIPEEYPVGLSLPRPFTVLGGSKDNALTYSLSGDDSSMFDIDSKTGAMKLKQRIDSESNTTKTLFDSLTVTVTDSDAKKKEANVTITFIDINDNEPKFDKIYIFANATENSANDTLVTQLTYSDLDQGPNGNVTLKLSDVSNSIFRLDGDNLYVDGSRLDFEDKNLSDHQHVVVIQAVDNPTSSEPKTGQAVVVVKILPNNEYNPVWSQPNLDGNGSFPNKSLMATASPLAEVGNFTATDQDGGADGHVTYSLVSAVSENGENVTNAFAINALTGILVTTAHVDSGAIKASPYYDITVGAEDGGTPPRRVEGKIRILVDVSRVVSPLIKTARVVSQYIGEVFENMAVGDVVKNFTDTFPGSDKTNLTVTGKWNDTFSFEGLSLKLIRKLDYEDTRMHFVDIRLSDGTREETTVMSINVKDVTDEPPEIHMLSSYIPEELPPLSVVGRIFKVTDTDFHDTLTYNLTGSHAKYFNIDASTGQLTMKEKLDRDGKDGVLLLDQLLLKVTDSAGLTTNSSLNLTVLDMNDNTPMLSSTVMNLNVTENSTSGIILSTLICEDPDEGPNGNCSLQLSTDIGIFKLNGSDLTADGSVIDYEALSDQQYMYKIMVLITDHPQGSEPRTSSSTINIKVR